MDGNNLALNKITVAVCALIWVLISLFAILISLFQVNARGDLTVLGGFLLFFGIVSLILALVYLWRKFVKLEREDIGLANAENLARQEALKKMRKEELSKKYKFEDPEDPFE